MRFEPTKRVWQYYKVEDGLSTDDLAQVVVSGSFLLTFGKTERVLDSYDFKKDEWTERTALLGSPKGASSASFQAVASSQTGSQPAARSGGIVPWLTGGCVVDASPAPLTLTWVLLFVVSFCVGSADSLSTFYSKKCNDPWDKNFMWGEENLMWSEENDDATNHSFYRSGRCLCVRRVLGRQRDDADDR
ncbi:MAG: hypothetical protein KAI47_05840 [Deltaproteobacteria bacterium]|nr:hypothetical protein [Deltaproteobacteria bacterium]